MKKNLLLISIIIICSFIMVFTTQLFKNKDDNNGFRRLFKNHNLHIAKVSELPSNLFYFAGKSDSKIYLKDLSTPHYLFTINYDLDKLKKIDLKLGRDSNVQPERVNIGLEKDMIYIDNNKTGEFSIIPIHTGKKYSFNNELNNLDQPVLISNKFIAGRDVSFGKNEILRRLIKFDFDKNRIVREYLLKKQVDGFFCTDGLLKFDSQHSKLFYTYFYRGEFLCLDTNLNLLYKAKTVDTNRIAKIIMAKVAKTPGNKDHVLTQASPPMVVNRDFTLVNNCIYIQSALKSDNETASDFRAGQIIDVYTDSSGKYLYSFYIPKYKHKKLREFRIFRKNIFAIFDNYLVSFTSYQSRH